MRGAAPSSHRWLFLRGLVRETRHWGAFPQKMSDALSAHGPVGPPLLLDLPGVGTERGRAVPKSVSGFVDELRPRFLAAREADERLSLFAVSLGGMVALDWLARFPDDFERAVIVNTSAADLSTPFERFRPRNYPAILKAALSRGARRERAILSFTANRPDLDTQGLASAFARYSAELPVSVRVLVAQLRAAMMSRTPAHLAVPTLFLASRADRLVSWTCSERIAKRLDAPLALHDSAGHDLPLDEPDWVIEQVGLWLQKQAAAA